MEFGYHYHSFDHQEPYFDTIVDRVQWLEDVGFEWVSVMDHLWQIDINGHDTDPFFESYTTLGGLAASTEHITIGPLVTCPLYRNPGLLAKMLMTLDHLSDGRVIFGIGAGWAEHEFRAYGYEFPPPAERVARMEETIEIAKALWNGPSPVSYKGDYYELNDVAFEPPPRQSPHPPVLVGGGGEKLTLRVVAKHADYWNIPSASPAVFDKKLNVLKEHCDAVGRDFDNIGVVGHNWIVLADETEKAHERYEELQSDTEDGLTPRTEHRGLVGTAAEVTETLEEYRELGVEQFIIKPPKGDDRTLERFVDDVLPQFD